MDWVEVFAPVVFEPYRPPESQQRISGCILRVRMHPEMRWGGRRYVFSQNIFSTGVTGYDREPAVGGVLAVA